MPFTISHAAVAAPLARRGLVLSAVAVGSMAPDFEYFLRLSMQSRWGHSPTGVLTFCLPVSLLVLWLFHNFLKRPLIATLPTAHRARLAACAGPFAFGPWPRFLRIVASILIGVVSHLFFDAWTHENGFMVEHCALLRQSLLNWPSCPLPVYEALQAVLSAVMLLAIGVQYWRWLRRTAPAPVPLTTFLDVRRMLAPWAVIGTVALAAGLAYAAATAPPVRDIFTFRVFGGRVVLASLSMLDIEFILFGWFRARQPVGAEENES